MNNGRNIDPVKTGKFIATLRKQHNLTQEDLGDKIFISRKSVSKWETGKCCPSIDMLKKLSEALGVSLEELIAGEFIDSPKKKNKKIDFKLFRSKSFKFICLTLLFSVLIYSAYSFIGNLNSDKTYIINYEDNRFSITNGLLALSKNGSYIDVGNVYTNIERENLRGSYLISLYYINEDNEKIELMKFNTDEIVNISKHNYKTIKKLIDDGNSDKFYFGLIYTDKNDVETIYNLNIKLTEQYGFDEDDDSGITAFKNDTNDCTDKNCNYIDLSFLYMMDSASLEKYFDGKSITVDKEKYDLIFNNVTKSLLVLSAEYKISFNFEINSITISDDKKDIYDLNDHHKVYGNIETKNFNLINNIYLELMKLFNGH